VELNCLRASIHNYRIPTFYYKLETERFSYSFGTTIKNLAQLLFNVLTSKETITA